MTVALRNQPSSILIVEDDVRALDALTDLLEASGYAVQRAHNGQEALLQARAQPPGMILLDLSMPLMDGWEFMRQQRLEPSIAGIPVVVITALVSAVPAGAKALVTKPINVNRLMSLVEKYCTSASSS
jgi:two-component system sensor histidine kinase/response regulator